MSRIVSVWLPAWPIERSRRHRGEGEVPRDRPLALVEAGAHGLEIAAVNESARALRIAPRTGLADARAGVPALATRPAERSRDMAALAGLARWCGRYGPARHVDGEDGLWIDITGVAHLFVEKGCQDGGDVVRRGEAALLADLGGRLAAAGFTAHAAIADTLGAAHAMARFATTGAAHALIVLPGGVREVLAPLPVAALRLDAATIRLLERLGLRRIGDLYGLPRAGLERRFRQARGRSDVGPGAAAGVLLRLDQALGEISELRAALPEPLQFLSRLPFSEPLVTAAGIEAAVERLARELAAALETRGAGGRRFHLMLFRSDGTVGEVEVGTSALCRDGGHIRHLLGERIGQLDAGLGVDLMTLRAREVERFEDHAASLESRSPAGQAEATTRLIDRLSVRLGATRVRRLRPLADHIPERAQTLQPALGASLEDGPAAAWKNVMLPGDARGGTPAPSWRPALILDPPEPVTVLAAVPEGAPALVTWRRVRRRIVRASGPERIAPAWWRLIGGALDGTPGMERRISALTRDYYVIEDTAGTRYWVFRAGLYDREEGADGEEEPRWLMHGVGA